MDDAVKAWKISILVFGPLREHVGREKIELSVVTKTTVIDVIKQFNLEKWIELGLKAAIDGTICSLDSMLHDGAEIALLPPVSGG
ncbi:MAG: MoaD/ThiS family protein [Candidatus Thermoplasmatota archaeon]|nr:MoaD/ThiS family protein [Candidatus Thermoplasmatota archaeon]